jgi:glycosyltransferase involved in cell wall biosynthesis
VGDSKFGGGSIVILELAQAAAAAGWRVEVLTTDPEFTAHLEAAGIAVVPFGGICRAISPLRDLSALIRLVTFLRKRPYTVVHTHTSKAGFVGRLAARIARVPIIVHTLHGFAFHEYSGKLTVSVYAALERLAAHCCDRVVTVSRFHRDWALRLAIGDSSKVFCIPNGVASHQVPDGTRERYRKTLGIAPDESVILAVGRLAALKGMEHLIDAARILESTAPTAFRVLIVGDGPIRQLLEDKARSVGVLHRTHFLGFRTDVHELLSACDIVALPTQREGLSIALLEAMSAAKPIVTTTIGSNKEVCGPSQCAILVPPEDPGALAGAITELIQSPQRSADIAARARSAFERDYRLDRMLAAYHELYLELIARRANDD